MGTGNVAKHLYNIFLDHSEIEVSEVVGRNQESLSYFSKKTRISTTLQFTVEAAIYIIAISDDAIPMIADKLHNLKGVVVHTSGSVAMDKLPKNVKRGVFYPLQTFTKNKMVDFSKIPICIEAENEVDLNLLTQLASLISDEVVEVSSKQRSELHIAAVFVNNFTNHLFYLGQKICEDNALEFDLLRPLIAETIKKIKDTSPLIAQTGPAKRNDVNTMVKHLSFLKNEEHKNIYKAFSRSIKKLYEKEL